MEATYTYNGNDFTTRMEKNVRALSTNSVSQPQSQHGIATHTANEGAPDKSLGFKHGGVGGSSNPPKKRRDVQSLPPCVQCRKPMQTIPRYEQRIAIAAGAYRFVDC